MHVEHFPVASLSSIACTWGTFQTVSCCLPCSNLAALLKARGQYADAEQLYRQTVDELTSALGREHSDTLAARSNLASLLYCQAQYDEAEEMYRDVIATSERVLGPKNPGEAGRWKP